MHDDQQSSHPTPDLTNCDREPIHILGHVQDFGALLAVSSDWIIVHASENLASVLGLPTQNVVGLPANEVLPPNSLHELRSKLQILAFARGNVRLFAFDLHGDGRLFDISMHLSGSAIILEFEPKKGISPKRDDMAMVQPLIDRIRRKTDLPGLLTEAARALKALTGLDRVMVYRFAEDDTGEVVAEALDPGQEPYLGLRYPASDIPKQARALYLANPLRLIADVDAPVHAISPALNPKGEPLDLSFAVTRAVSSIHLEYLRNMGVRASMSASIINDQKLWGLFACHHRTPFYIDYELRSAVELFTQLFNYELAQLEQRNALRDQEQARKLHEKLLVQISNQADLVAYFDTVAKEFAEAIQYDGIAIYSNGTYRAQGSAPTEEEFLPLARFLNTTETSQIFHSYEIGRHLPEAANFADRAVGLMALPISRTPRDYIVFFRREVQQMVTWAGSPEKPVETGPNGIRLTPRKSFEAWKQVVTGRSDPWKPNERRVAESLRVTLLEVVLKLSDEANSMRKRAQDQQELLIAELNHRVRNILNLIQGLVSQGRGGAMTIDDYCTVLDARITALARAHDQLTRKDWGWVSLEKLIRTEATAFLQQKSNRILLDLEPVELSPNAFTAMALVIHELVTNSAKYGALSDQRGAVRLTGAFTSDGSYNLHWAEQDGPPVQMPSRKGFGMTIIERTIPFELKGTAQIDFHLTGVQTQFSIPTKFVRLSAPEVTPAEETRPMHPQTELKLSGSVLVVEDNMIIALDASDILSDLGASEVLVAATVAQAERYFQDNEIRFALLDVNLGSETSRSLAQHCIAQKIPYALATGYGGDPGLENEFPDAIIVSKPYGIDDIRTVLSELARNGALKS